MDSKGGLVGMFIQNGESFFDRTVDSNPSVWTTPSFWWLFSASWFHSKLINGWISIEGTTWENTVATRRPQPPTIHPTLDPPLHQLPSVGHIARNEQIHVTGTWFLNLGESSRVSSETWDVKNEWKRRKSGILRTTKWTNYLTWLGKFQPCHQQ